MDSEHDRRFDEFTSARYRALRRTAYLLCGDWHLAEDLVQTTLVKLYAGWHRLRDDDAVDAYARRILVRTYIDGRRLRRSGELPVAAVPDTRPAPGEDSARRLALLDALAHMTPVYRAVLVLRYWEDQSIEDTAALLGKSSAAVRSAASRGLDQLRTLLGDSLVDIAQN